MINQDCSLHSKRNLQTSPHTRITIAILKNSCIITVFTHKRIFLKLFFPFFMDFNFTNDEKGRCLNIQLKLKLTREVGGQFTFVKTLNSKHEISSLKKPNKRSSYTN